MRKTLLAIDPSVNNCGVALFDRKTKQLEDAILLHPDKIVKRDGEFYDKAFSIYTKAKEICRKCCVIEIVCELPDHWAVAGFAARESGSITKLSFMCGLFYALRNEVEKFTFTLPRGWKGQLSKDVTKNRIERDYAGKGKHYTKEEWEKLDHNVCDAIGIGHWKLHGRV